MDAPPPGAWHLKPILGLAMVRSKSGVAGLVGLRGCSPPPSQRCLWKGRMAKTSPEQQKMQEAPQKITPTNTQHMPTPTPWQPPLPKRRAEGLLLSFYSLSLRRAKKPDSGSLLLHGFSFLFDGRIGVQSYAIQWLTGPSMSMTGHWDFFLFNSYTSMCMMAYLSASLKFLLFPCAILL